MKTMMKITVITFVFSLMLLLPLGVNADPPGMPDNHGANGDVPGGGAPIGEGIVMLIAMSAAYDSKKFFQLNKAE